jgi:Lar family restriction alleviation protein
MITELKDCPFCGCTVNAYSDIRVDVGKNYEHQAYVECMSCGAKGPVCSSEEIAAKYWNKPERVQEERR